jgi:hypothetical protein
MSGASPTPATLFACSNLSGREHDRIVIETMHTSETTRATSSDIGCGPNIVRGGSCVNRIAIAPRCVYPLAARVHVPYTRLTCGFEGPVGP